MNYVEKLLKGRKAGAELELSHCDPENPDYDEPRAKRIEEINQIEKALLVLHSVSKQRELLLAYHNHLDNFNDPTIYNASESMIDDYLANNCC